jgi:transcriptional regulator GlxA family with amidase domain
LGKYFSRTRRISLVQFTTHIFTIDKNRFTCSGGLAAIDLGLELVEIHYPNIAKKSVSNLLSIKYVRQ